MGQNPRQKAKVKRQKSKMRALGQWDMGQNPRQKAKVKRQMANLHEVGSVIRVIRGKKTIVASITNKFVSVL